MKRTTEELLCDLKQATDPAAISTLREEIVSHHIGLVKSIATEFRSSGEPLDDLIQTGYIGLLSAVANFDPARGIKFTTYATYLIKGEMRHYIRDKCLTIRIPQWIQTLNNKIKQEEARFFQEQGRPPTIAELAQLLNLTTEGIAEVLKARDTMTYISIDQERREHDPRPPLIDISKIRSSQNTDFPLEHRMEIITAIESLTQIQRDIVTGLFYESKSQQELGKELNLSQRQVSRLKAQLLNKIKERLAAVPPDGN
ncbi:sigma-70 family RNA polymerase sigma factor [Candidatus Acetothermia bacterium]|nr:sigma-70 family RNA polymerase sigma factor [Candidatus Acetothermia bacterium]